MAIFRRAGVREAGLPLPLVFQYLILMCPVMEGTFPSDEPVI